MILPKKYIVKLNNLKYTEYIFLFYYSVVMLKYLMIDDIKKDLENTMSKALDSLIRNIARLEQVVLIQVC